MMNRLQEILREIQAEFRSGARRFTTHALEEATDDDLSVDEIIEAIVDDNAEIIEDYPENTRGACCLILGRTESSEVIHCVMSYPPDAAVVTVYRPDSSKWVQISEEETPMKCVMCKGQTEDRIIRYVQDYKGRVVIAENVPAEVCTQCGERYIRGDVAKQIQNLVWQSPAPDRKTEVPIYDLSKSHEATSVAGR